MTSKEETFITDVAIAVAGSVDSGKSSLIGVLISGELDDGNGKARKLVAKHPHEIETGKTSSISTRMCKLDKRDGIRRAVTLIDLCGHEKYFKTTSFGISGYFPDYAFVIVSANRGILPMTKQHIRLLLALNVQLVFIITHVDTTPHEIYMATCEAITKICKLYAGKNTSTMFLNSMDDYVRFTEDQEKENVNIALKTPEVVKSVYDILTNTGGRQLTYPVLTISNKNGFYIDVLRSLVDVLPQRAFWSPTNDSSVTNNKIIKFFKAHIDPALIPEHTTFNGSIFYIDSAYNPPGIGLVVTGINRGIAVQPGNTMYMGPIGKDFIEVRVKSLHNNVRQNVDSLDDHHRGCIAFAPRKAEITRDKIDKGMLMISSLSLAKNLCFHFKAAITVFNASITLKTGYSPVIHMSTIRQTAKLILPKSTDETTDDKKGNELVLTTGNVAVVTFKFKIKPEFLEPYNLFVFRSGDIHGFGMVISPISLDVDTDGKPDMVRKFHRRMIGPKHAHKPKSIPVVKKI